MLVRARLLVPRCCLGWLCVRFEDTRGDIGATRTGFVATSVTAVPALVLAASHGDTPVLPFPGGQQLLVRWGHGGDLWEWRLDSPAQTLGCSQLRLRGFL